MRRRTHATTALDDSESTRNIKLAASVSWQIFDNLGDDVKEIESFGSASSSPRQSHRRQKTPSPETERKNLSALYELERQSLLLVVLLRRAHNLGMRGIPAGLTLYDPTLVKWLQAREKEILTGRTKREVEQDRRRQQQQLESSYFLCSSECEWETYLKNHKVVGVDGKEFRATGDVMVCKRHGTFHVCTADSCDSTVSAPSREGLVCRLTGRCYGQEMSRSIYDTGISPEAAKRARITPTEDCLIPSISGSIPTADDGGGGGGESVSVVTESSGYGDPVLEAYHQAPMSMSAARAGVAVPKSDAIEQILSSVNKTTASTKNRQSRKRGHQQHQPTQQKVLSSGIVRFSLMAPAPTTAASSVATTASAALPAPSLVLSIEHRQTTSTALVPRCSTIVTVHTIEDQNAIVELDDADNYESSASDEAATVPRVAPPVPESFLEGVTPLWPQLAIAGGSLENGRTIWKLAVSLHHAVATERSKARTDGNIQRVSRVHVPRREDARSTAGPMTERAGFGNEGYHGTKFSREQMREMVERDCRRVLFDNSVRTQYIEKLKSIERDCDRDTKNYIEKRTTRGRLPNPHKICEIYATKMMSSFERLLRIGVTPVQENVVLLNYVTECIVRLWYIQHATPIATQQGIKALNHCVYGLLYLLKAGYSVTARVRKSDRKLFPKDVIVCAEYLDGISEAERAQYAQQQQARHQTLAPLPFVKANNGMHFQPRHGYVSNKQQQTTTSAPTPTAVDDPAIATTDQIIERDFEPPIEIVFVPEHQWMSRMPEPGEIDNIVPHDRDSGEVVSSMNSIKLSLASLINGRLRETDLTPFLLASHMKLYTGDANI